MAKKFYITTPIYYTNGEVHIGGAYTTIAADVLARWHHLLGEDVFFLTGTDEHGQKIQETAEKAGLKPKEFVDKMVKSFKEAFKMLNISNNNFIRTTDKEHEEEVKKILQELYDKKFIYKGFYESIYCIGCEQYITQSDFVNGKCPLHNREPEIRKEEAYLFRLSSFQKDILKLIKSGKYCILPENKRKEIIGFIKSGLQDISISRLKEKTYWGIELPFDRKHTCFVWVDAFWNYLTGLKEKKAFDKFWPADVQLMAKDILRVHATIWPALLLATKNKLPKTLFVHGYFTINNQKMSKTLGNVISPIYLAQTYGADSTRYFLMRNISFGEDGDFSEQALIERHNNELADKLGNLVSRVSALAEKYSIAKTQNKLIKKLKLKEIYSSLGNYHLDKALNLIFEFIDKCNEYVQESKIWETHNSKALYELADSIKAIAILISPFIPETSEKIARIFNFDISLKAINTPLKPSKIKKAPILFQKIIKAPFPDSRIEGIATMNQISFNEFQKADMRVGKIKKAEDIEGADKLYKLEVEADKPRTLVAGLKQYYKKEELKNKHCIVLTNLEPRTMKGITSEGMILAAVSEDHKKVVLIQPEKDIPLGARVQ